MASNTSNNSTTLRFINAKFGAQFAEDLTRFVDENSFAFEWDGDPIEDLNFKRGAVKDIYARDVDLDEVQSIIQAAKAEGVSIVVHMDWLGSDEGEVAGQILFHDAELGRSGEINATRNSIEPLVGIADAMSLSKSALAHKYLLPAVLCPEAAAHLKSLQS